MKIHDRAILGRLLWLATFLLLTGAPALARAANPTSPPRRLSADCASELEPLIRPKYERLRGASSSEAFAARLPMFEPDEFALLSPQCQPFADAEWASFRAGQTFLIAALVRPGDDVALVENDPSSSNAVREQPLVILDQYPDAEVWLFARTAGVNATAFVSQSDADVIWTHEFRRQDHAGLHWRHTACVDINLDIDAGSAKRAVLFDGQQLGPKLQWQEGGANDYRAAGVIQVPLPPAAGIDHMHEIDIVRLPSNGSEMTSLWKGALSVDMPAQAAIDDPKCIAAQLPDLRSRYALARVSVSGDCEATGILPPQIRAYVQQFVQGRKMSITQTLEHPGLLDAVESLERGNDPHIATAQNIRSLAALADRFEAQGVTKLLTVDVHCGASQRSARVLARTVDLTKLGEQLADNAQGTSVDMADVLKSFEVPIADQRLEDGIELALGMTLSQPVVALDQPAAHVDYSTPRRARRSMQMHGIVDALEDFRIVYRAEGPKDKQPQIEVGVALLKDSDIANRLCAEIDAEAKLATVTEGMPEELAKLSRLGQLESTKAHNRDRNDEAKSPGNFEIVFFRTGGANEVTSPLTAPVGPVGKYVVWVRDQGGASFSAACFEVQRRDWTISVQLGGMLSVWRSPWSADQGDKRETQYEAHCEATEGCSYASGTSRDRVNYYDVKLRVTDTFGRTEMGRIGGVLGYDYMENVVYRTIDGSIDESESDRLNWRRRGATLGVVLGLEMPLTRCTRARLMREFDWASKCSDRRRRSFSLAWLNTASANFGLFALSASPWKESPKVDFAVDFSSQALLRFQINPLASVFLFYEVTLHDLDGWISQIVGRDPSYDYRASYLLKNAFGIGFSAHLRVYKPSR